MINSYLSSVTVLGAAIGDIVLAVDKLPQRGGDVAAQYRSEQIGGCGFNVLRLLAHLGCPVINGITVGNGSWATKIEKAMNELNIPIYLRSEQDNGWCMVLVEPDGERTFVTVYGCEMDWQQQTLARLPLSASTIYYASGYELQGKNGGVLGEWLVKQKGMKFLDLGPLIQEVDLNFLDLLQPQDTILTLNQDELCVLVGSEENLIEKAKQYAATTKRTLICRLGKQGSWIVTPDQSPEKVAPFVVNVADTIGAGDSHCAGVLLGLAAGRTLKESVRLGNKIAAYTVSQYGVEHIPSWSDLAALG